MIDYTHLLVSMGWIIYAVIVGVMAVIYNYQSSILWVSVIVAIVGNSAHMVTLAYSQGKLQASSNQAQKTVEPGKVN